MTRPIWINIITKRVYKIQKPRYLAKQKFAHIYDVIKN